MIFTRDMQRALEADGEKLRQLTGDDHGPRFPEFARQRSPDGEPFECPDPLTCRFPRCDCQPASSQHLVARIKRSSKYWGQTKPNQWFDVRVVNDASYRLRGNNNNYRLGDVVIGMRLDDGSVVDLASGKVSK